MAASRLPVPGTEYGPCIDPCQHVDCALTREMAETQCVYCSAPIGYEVRFYREEGGTLSHATCAEDAEAAR